MSCNILKLSKLADKFCDKQVEEYPYIWWCFGNSDNYKILIYTDKWTTVNPTPKWFMNNEGQLNLMRGGKNEVF